MNRQSRKDYWRNLTEWERDLQEQDPSRDEFVPEPSGPFPMDRRRFLALVAASTALGAGGCDRLEDRGQIVPYVDQPEGSPPGTPRFYASTLTRFPGAPPILATVREGRPVKLEGNPDHPSSLGGLDAWGQSAILGLYDPDRLREPQRGKAAVSWDEADSEIRSTLERATLDNKAILLFTPALSSPTARQLIADFTTAYPTTVHLPVETFHLGEVVAGQRQVLGHPDMQRVDWSRADVVLSLEADFLGPTGSPGTQRGFSLRRRPEKGSMNRLWCVEGGMSVTSANADHRLPLRPSLQELLALGLLHAAVERHSGPLGDHPGIVAALTPYALEKQQAVLGLEERAIKALVADLLDHPQRSVVLAGEHLPASVHALVAALNATLGNLGSTLTSAGTPENQVASPADLTSAMEAARTGQVAAIVDLEANPAFILPPDLEFAASTSAVPLIVSSCQVADETAELAHLVLPAAHDLEAWGDADPHPGVLSLQQPVIAPLFSSRQREESLLRWLPESPDRPATYRDYLRIRWQRQVYAQLNPLAPFVSFWNAALHDGFVTLPESTPTTPQLRPAGVRAAISAHSTDAPAGIDLVLPPSLQVYDGRFANSGWLQEMPHPITSQVWGNGALLGVPLAENLEVADGDLVELSLGGRTLVLPAVRVPGMADDVVQVHLGYGRRQAGSVGTAVGTDASRLRSLQGGVSPWIYTGATLIRTSGKGKIVRTQQHHDIHGRHLIMEGTEVQFRERPDFAAAIAGRDTSPSPGKWQYERKWGMAIDLSACTGCNGCLVSCVAENNIPVVGPEQVDRGREMHWIRVDRYYKGDPHRPQEVELLHQPMLCQQCDNAPCENVCPVAATSHSEDGLNEMTYNRCVGTRYCANNCPYKVRRFNYLAYHDELRSPRELAFNPEVTVRSRGVMEKCNFCVQRLQAARRAAKREGRPLRDGEATAACQQACPTDAIVIGDLNDPQSRVSRLAASSRGYHVLAELGVRPSITYLAKIRNPHPDLTA